MKIRVQYKKESKIEIYYQGIITTRLLTCNLRRVQSLMILITQIQWDHLMEVWEDVCKMVRVLSVFSAVAHSLLPAAVSLSGIVVHTCFLKMSDDTINLISIWYLLLLKMEMATKLELHLNNTSTFVKCFYYKHTFLNSIHGNTNTCHPFFVHPTSLHTVLPFPRCETTFSGIMVFFVFVHVFRITLYLS